MKQLAKTLLLGCVAVFIASSQAWADGDIQKVRLGGTPQYDRLVFVLSSSSADVYSVDGDRYLVEFQANPPSLDFKTEDKLSGLGVKIERSNDGTRVAIDKRGRNIEVFKLPPADANSGPRVVLDISKGAQALSVPADAERVPTRSGSAPAPQVPVLGGDPPQSASIETPQPTPGVGMGESNLQPAPAPTPSDPGREEVWVSVRAIDFEGVTSEAPSRDDLLNLELNVSVAENGDLVAPRTDLPVQTVTLRALTGERQSGRVGGSLLQQIVERIADEYEERGKYGTRIDISKRDLERLLKDQDGRLVIRISEPSDAGASS
jgi:hypothetical protein